MAKLKISAPTTDTNWETRNDFETLCRAKAIEKDSKRMAKVRDYAKACMMDAAGIAGEDD